MRHTNLKNRLATWALCGVFGALCQQGTAFADGSMRCKTKLVSAGAASYEVRSLCGTPDDMQSRTETRSVRRQVTVACNPGLCSTFVEDTVNVNVEEWIYDFGPQRFIQFLIFEQGKLVQIRSGGYGKKQITSE